MTIRVTTNEFEEQFQEADEEELQWDASDELDITYKFDTRFSQGWSREIQLREGIGIRIDRHQPIDHLIISAPGEEFHSISCIFTLSGKGQLIIPSTLNETRLPEISGTYILRSNGSQPQCIFDESEIDPYSFLYIDIHPSVLCSFTVSPGGEIPKNLQHLIKNPSQDRYQRSGNITPMMAMVLQQILNCPHQGILKRIFLETKATELVGLVVEQEIAIGQGEVKKVSLKPEQIERIHYAKEILFQDLSNPPSLEKLARQAGLNEFLLKKGFRYCFDSTVFSELRNYRLDLAMQLLAEQEILVAEVAKQIGYASVGAFAKAFKKKFGLSPKAYQKTCR